MAYNRSLGNINFGNQQIEYRFLEELRSKDVSRLLRDILKAGIYKGGLINVERINEYKISISPLVAIVNNNSTEDAYNESCFVIRTREKVVLQLAGAGSYYIVMEYAHRPRIENYADFYYIPGKRGEKGNLINPNMVVIGRVEIYPNNTFEIDYDERDWGLSYDNRDVYVKGAIFTTDLNVYNPTLRLNHDSDEYTGSKVIGTKGVVNNNGIAGIEVDRGVYPDVMLNWNEQSKSWMLNDGFTNVYINEVIHYPCVKKGIIKVKIENFSADKIRLYIEPNQEFYISGRIYNTSQFPFEVIIDRNDNAKKHIRFTTGKNPIYNGYIPNVEQGFYIVNDISISTYSPNRDKLVETEFMYQKETNNFNDFLLCEVYMQDYNTPVVKYVRFPLYKENRITMYSNDFIRIKRERDLLYWQLLSDDPNDVSKWRPFA